MTKVVFPSPTHWIPPAAATPPVSAQDPGLMTALQEKLKEARARLGRKRRSRKLLLQVLAERVLDSTADALVTAELDNSRRRKCRTGSPEEMIKKNRGERGRESKKRGRSSSSGETVESCSSDEGLGREDGSKVRRTAATKPGALLLSGLIMMQPHLGRQVEDCEAVDAVQAKGLAAAYLATALKPQAGGRFSFGALRELQSLAEAVDLLMRGRLASVGDVLIQRFRAVEAASLEEGGWSVARHLELLPEAAVSSMSSGLRGVAVKAERARLQLRRNQCRRSPREEEARHLTRDQRWRSAVEEEVPRTDQQKRPGRKMGGERPPEGSAAEHPGPRRGERPEQGKAEQVAEEEEAARLVVWGARGLRWERGTWARSCRPTASTWRGPGAPMEIRAAVETRLKLRFGPSRAARQWYRGTENTSEALQEGGCGTDCTNWLGKSVFVTVHWTKSAMSTKFSQSWTTSREPRSQEDRPPNLSGMSLAEVGFALKSHLLAPRSESAETVVNFVLQHTGFERKGISKDILPFPLSFSPQQLKYRSRWKQEGHHLARPKRRKRHWTSTFKKPAWTHGLS